MTFGLLLYIRLGANNWNVFTEKYKHLFWLLLSSSIQKSWLRSIKISKHLLHQLNQNPKLWSVSVFGRLYARIASISDNRISSNNNKRHATIPMSQCLCSFKLTNHAPGIPVRATPNCTRSKHWYEYIFYPQLISCNIKPICMGKPKR